VLLLILILQRRKQRLRRGKKRQTTTTTKTLQVFVFDSPAYSPVSDYEAGSIKIFVA